MKKLTLLLITLCMLITTTYAYNVIKTVNQNQLITTVNSGEVVTVTYSDVAGYTFNGWSVTGVSIANLSSKQIVFTMPANDVTIEPNMVKDEKYALTWIINNVTHVLEKAPGDSVTLTANDTEGYTFTNWTATGITLQDTSAKTINFTMPHVQCHQHVVVGQQKEVH